MKKIISQCLLLSLLSGCALFGKDPLQIDGERIEVIREDKNLQPDYASGEVKVRLPKAKLNRFWSQNGGSAGHVGRHLKAGGNLDEIWDTSFGAGTSKRNVLLASPVAADGIIFTLDAEGIAKAFRLDNGKQVWKRRLKPDNKEERDSSVAGAGLAVVDGKVFATTGFGKVFAINATDGSIIWANNLKAPIRIAPTVAADLVIVQTLDNGIYALDINDGKLLWKDKLEAENTTMIGGAAPAYSPDDDLVIATFSNGQIQAYKASTGTPLWQEWIASSSGTDAMADITAVTANPIIDEGLVFAVGYNAPLLAIDIRTGAKIWQRQIAASSQPWVAGKFLFVLTTDGDLAALDKQTGKIVWTTIIPYASGDERIGIFTSGPLLANDALLVTASNGKLFSVSPYNGRIMGIADIEKGVETAPIMVDESLVITTKNAKITVYK
jgi:outer membrane protein assembly factor BamB